jgi:predicted  nucleic acid-binding Zn-ribbon protein
MPHICTRCKNVFDSGEDILKGCPKCGWKKFMFVKKGPEDSKGQSEQIITRAMGVRVPPGMRKNQPEIKEDKMQKEMIQASRGTLSAAAHPPEHHHPSRKSQDEDIHQDRSPHQDKAPHQDGFPPSEGKKVKSSEKTLESVKITAPGTYELNLPSLFERDELIMAVKEGTYFIDLASVFKKSKKD